MSPRNLLHRQIHNSLIYSPTIYDDHRKPVDGYCLQCRSHYAGNRRLFGINTGDTKVKMESDDECAVTLIFIKRKMELIDYN